MKKDIFGLVAPCNLAAAHLRFRSASYLYHQGDGDGRSKHLWCFDDLLPNYKALQPRRHQSSYSQPWQPKIVGWLNNFTYELAHERKQCALSFWQRLRIIFLLCHNDILVATLTVYEYWLRISLCGGGVGGGRGSRKAGHGLRAFSWTAPQTHDSISCH